MCGTPWGDQHVVPGLGVAAGGVRCRSRTIAAAARSARPAGRRARSGCARRGGGRSARPRSAAELMTESDRGRLARRAPDRSAPGTCPRRSTGPSCGPGRSLEPWPRLIGISIAASVSSTGIRSGRRNLLRRRRCTPASDGAAAGAQPRRQCQRGRARRGARDEPAAAKAPAAAVRSCRVCVQLLDLELAPHERVHDAEVPERVADLGPDLAGLRRAPLIGEPGVALLRAW